MTTTRNARRTLAPGLESLEGKILLSLPGLETTLGSARGASVVAQPALEAGNRASTVPLSKLKYTSVDYPLDGVEGKPINSALVASFAIYGDGAKALPFHGLVSPEDEEEFLDDPTITVRFEGHGRYDVYFTGTPLEEGADELEILMGEGRTYRFDLSIDAYIHEAPLSQVGPNTTFYFVPGVNTGMVELGQFADGNKYANLDFDRPGETDYKVTIDWGDNSELDSFESPLTTSAGIITGDAKDWIIRADHTYKSSGATSKTYPVVITVEDLDGGATVTLHATAVESEPTLQIIAPVMPSGAVAGQLPWGPVPFAEGLWVIGQFNPPLNELPSAYTISVDWGDGTISPAHFYQEPNPLMPGDFLEILDDHIYATGGPAGAPQKYTITVTITGPGLDEPLTGTVTEYVTQSGAG